MAACPWALHVTWSSLSFKQRGVIVQQWRGKNIITHLLIFPMCRFFFFQRLLLLSFSQVNEDIPAKWTWLVEKIDLIISLQHLYKSLAAARTPWAKIYILLASVLKNKHFLCSISVSLLCEIFCKETRKSQRLLLSKSVVFLNRVTGRHWHVEKVWCKHTGCPGWERKPSIIRFFTFRFKLILFLSGNHEENTGKQNSHFRNWSAK